MEAHGTEKRRWQRRRLQRLDGEGGDESLLFTWLQLAHGAVGGGLVVFDAAG